MSRKTYTPSISSSIKSTNSTCPLPHNHRSKPKNKLSHDVTTLYELFSNVPTKTNKPDGVMCYCCERRITKNQITELDRKRKNQDTSNKVTSALYYGSSQVRKYMKKVMTRESWFDLIKNGFPCPHRVLWSTAGTCHHFCTVCDTDQTQETLRLTLTPSAYRAPDNQIYGECSQLQSLAKTKKRKGRKFIRF
ncbi:hypothetical protein BDF21DRAFT_410973 [Thamnidium elegans]|uniref:Uncharacterized protein n=1 Tax=Thamnidium elegans TaxID=101142 RepID=A0A8H7SKJ9_9FUNG|nr:hypothetical protein INT48_002900 [Thamnidium elegans]KAI8092119.1 hypothetical protein BDF21DRAFT_410973 [Thamnidium elegans]